MALVDKDSMDMAVETGIGVVVLPVVEKAVVVPAVM